jgi:histidinol dehydrogenase
MLTRVDLRGDMAAPERSNRLRAELSRLSMANEPSAGAVQAIIDQVRMEGDSALRELTKRFDGVEIDDIRVPTIEMETALRDLQPLLREALEEAHESILAFHRFTKPQDERYERDGITVREIRRPVERAGCCMPGGVAQYPSSVLMSAVPARVAGVEKVVLCVAPGSDGSISQTVLAAAALAQVDEIYRVSGAQAVAALAYGTESVESVDVVVGPGDMCVARAKRLVSGVVGVPASFAGPSEVVVIADETTPPEYAAIDLVVQAEHGADCLSWLVTWSEEAASAIETSVAEIVARSPRRAEVEAALSKGGYSIVVDDAQTAMDVANAVAPEQLELMSADPEALVPLVKHAGAIFAGIYAPASLGDYLAGPSHVLPDHSAARFGSALGVRDFLRDQHVISLDGATLSRVAPHVAAIAEAEGLDAHARSVRIRQRP